MTNTPQHIPALLPTAPSVWTKVGDELRARRQARAAHRALVRELATYTTPSEMDDLLGSLRGQEGADVEAIRTILTNQLRSRATRLAS
jgi:hypothetical protein